MRAMSGAHPKHATPDHPVHELLVQRWSPYSFAPRSVEPEKLLACLEASRWAASSFNEQPWSWLVAIRDDDVEFARMLACLVEANRIWAKNVGVLVLAVVRKTFSRNNKPNRVAEHDGGLAAANLAIQATALGLCVHQMAGINLAKARQTYGIPEGYDPLTALALGYAADSEQVVDAQLAERDRSPRPRKKLAEFVFSGAWNRSAPQVV